MDCSTPGFPVLHQFPELAQTLVYLILCRPLLLLLSVFPSIRVFSNKSPSHQVAKYWSFSNSVNLSNENSGLISFRIDWFELLEIQGILENRSAKGTSYRPRCGGRILIC
ncbi:unnamed protein product [Rangifer tarandus platyrhynchus]|uniref:Uncharacterized protein n=2 Tax=Rangifer tarandus platyrhynchus TaxID=3082113 RepID=A0AC59YKY3_RANTA|nr:unnamed protein product [Rangifer tarandus platyrhynchus]